MNNTTVLLRQVHPSFVQANNVSSQAFSVTSQAFRPTPKDNNQLSVYNSEKFTPDESFTHFTQEGNGNKSFGVMGVSCEECQNAALTYEENNDPFDGHSYIDFTNLGKNDIEKKAKILKAKAMERGWLFLNRN